MESNDRRQRHTNPSGYAAQPGLVPSSSHYVSSAPDRYRSTGLTSNSPTSAPSAGRGGGTQGYGYNYGEGAGFLPAVQSNSLQYSGEYSSQDQQQQQQQQQQRQSQQYSSYGSNMMYGVPSQAQSSSQSSFEAVQPYQARQAAGMEALTNQFDVSQQYFVAGQGGPTSAPAAGLATPNVSQQFSSMPTYTSTHSQVGRDSLANPYTSGMNEPGQSSSQGAYSTQNFAQETPNLDQAYAQYQTMLKRTFQDVRDHRLSEAGTSLLQISTWLVNNADPLGLVRDDSNLHADRLKLWEDFNICWLSVLQTQKEVTEQMQQSGRNPLPQQSVLSYEFMESMGKEIVRLCDIMEKHGLVDYQMGIWEEEIISMLTKCLDLLEGQDQSPSKSPNNNSSASEQRRH